MSVVPSDKAAKVNFYQIHVPVWQAAAATLGLALPELTSLETKTTTAVDALAAQQNKQEQARGAIADCNNAIDDMALLGAAIIKKIKGKAATDGEHIYTVAQIPAPAKPQPLPAPGTPTHFRLELLQDGSIILRWKCANPTGGEGVIYQVARKATGSAGEFVNIGATGKREFIDSTLPRSLATTGVTYQIIAVRSTQRGNPAEFNVNFGVGSGGAMMASVVESPKLAA